MDSSIFSDTKVGLLGLGYVGLPLALAFAKKFPHCIGFDINQNKVSAIRDGIDPTKEGLDEEIKASSLKVTHRIEDLKGCNFFIVGVPTPIDSNRNPDLSPVCSASELVGKVLTQGSVVVFESTVYPGVTEDICGPILERTSGLKRGKDFKLGYSPERINPGDKEHTVEKITKVVSGEDSATLERVAAVYGAVIAAGIHKAPSIKVAEAAKVIENTQRDLNIALMNELAIIFDRMGIATSDVLAAAGTKWNFQKFVPGLVGGHCIGVDPYYLTTRAEQLGYHPQVILSGRRINDDMGKWIGQRVVKLMIHAGFQPKGARVGILGITFKENVTDIRNSRIPDVFNELREFGIDVLVHDPMIDPAEAEHEYGIKVCGWSELKDLNAVVYGVPHRKFVEMGPDKLCSGLINNGVFVDVKSAVKRESVPSRFHYWSL